MIERLRAGEGPRLRAIRLRALADAPDAFGSSLEDAERRSPEDWEAQIHRLPTFVWREGDADHGADLGMVRGAPHDGDPEAAYLISMWVAPEARGRGVGAALVGEVVAWARGRGLRRLVLDVAEQNAWARRLYERCGFVATGRTGALPAPREHVRELEMALDLGPTRPAAPAYALALTVLPWSLTVCRLSAGVAVPAGLDAEPFAAVVRTPDETSLVCRAERVPDGIQNETGWRALRVTGPLDFALTGVLLSLLAPLAAAGVAVFALSTFDTDYVLVKEAALADAAAALEGAGHRVGPLGGGAPRGPERRTRGRSEVTLRAAVLAPAAPAPYPRAWLPIGSSARPTVVPALMFAGPHHGRARAAIAAYVDALPGSRALHVEDFAEGEGGEVGTVKQAVLELMDQQLVAMDGGAGHAFGFDVGMSLQVMCADQAEVDRIATTLAADGGEEGPCGWVRDRFGLWWQVVPEAVGAWMASDDEAASDRVFHALAPMLRLDVAALERAYRGR